MQDKELAHMLQRITELEAIEAKYKQTEAALEFERKRLYSVLEAIPVWVYLQAPDYSIRWGNSKFYELFGDPKGRPCYMALQQRQTPCIPCPTFRVFETKGLQKWEYTTCDGFTSIIYDNYFLDSDGSPLVLEMGIDITEQKQREREVRELNETLEQRVNERTLELADVNAKLSEALQALWSEMKLAKKIQTCLLPQKPHILGYDIAASCEPAEEVGGDYYDVISVADYDWIVIGDVSGHGVTAGLVMMMVQTAIHTALLQNPTTPPSHLLSAINRVIYKNIEKMKESKHMTIIVLAVEKNGIFSFAGLHEDILIWRVASAMVDKISLEGMWIGVDSDISDMLATETLKLDPGDCMILYTDGITESRDRDRKMFGEERLMQIIETSGTKTASQIHADIIESIRHYEKRDDVTLFVMKRL